MNGFYGEATKAQRLMAYELRRKGFEVLENIRLPGGEADLFLPEYKIVIELDGFFHLGREVKNRDRKKDRVWTDEGLTVFRFDNKDVLAKGKECVNQILRHIKACKRLSAGRKARALENHRELLRLKRDLERREKQQKMAVILSEESGEKPFKREK